MRKTLFTLFLLLFAFTTFAQNKPAMRINHVALYVQDLKSSTAFYKDFLGLEAIDEPFKIGRHSWFSIGDQAQLHLIKGATKPNQNEQNTHLCFSVLSFEAFLTKVKAAKMKYVDASGKALQITTRPDGIKQLWLQDPDGYWLEINDDQR